MNGNGIGRVALRAAIAVTLLLSTACLMGRVSVPDYRYELFARVNAARPAALSVEEVSRNTWVARAEDLDFDVREELGRLQVTIHNRRGSSLPIDARSFTVIESGQERPLRLAGARYDEPAPSDIAPGASATVLLRGVHSKYPDYPVPLPFGIDRMSRSEAEVLASIHCDVGRTFELQVAFGVGAMRTEYGFQFVIRELGTRRVWFG